MSIDAHNEGELLEQIEQGGDPPGRLGEMSRDRAELMALETEPAPRWLLPAALDEALGEVDREAIRLLGQGGGGAGPVVKTGPRRPLRLRVPIVPALAAAVVLLVGGVVGLNVMRWFGPTPAAPAARADHRAPGPGVAESPGAGSRPLADAGGVPPAAPAADEPGSVRLGGVPSLAEAAGLLREGRLALIARGGASVSIRPGLEAMAGHTGSWSVSPGVPGAALARIDLPEPGRLVFASGGHGPAGEMVNPVRTVWTARLDATPTALASLLDALGGLGLDVELRRLSATNPIEPPADAGDVLWWDRPPPSWRRPAAAALIVETLP